MAERVTVEQVMEIIDTGLSQGLVGAFIRTAHAMVEGRLGGSGLGEETLGLIELWLAAHLVCARDPRKKQVRAGEAAVTYQMEVTADGLRGTVYGQQVLLLDTSGRLADGGLKQARIEVLP